MSSSPSSSSTPRRRRSKSTKARKPRTDTRAAILEAAESLFIEMGYAGTSLRAIAVRAGVNLASAHYHFGSKAGLIGAVVHSRVGPVNDERARELDALLARTANPTVHEIVQVFLSPLASSYARPAVRRLIARLHGEPESLAKPLVEREFGPTADRFLATLSTALPDIEPDVLALRFHFVVGAMIHMLAFEQPLALGDVDRFREEGLDELLTFAVAGISHGTAPTTAPKTASKTGRKRK